MMKVFLSTCTVFIHSLLFSQISIKGPLCVTGGTVYQYLISGDIDLSTAKICITGGKFENTSDDCIKRNDGVVKLTWNQGAKNGKLEITSPKNGTTLNVTITQTLTGGNIPTSNKKQFVDSTSLAQSINCSPATGGSCTPHYEYQWQWSDNRVAWKDVQGETGQHLIFKSPHKKATYYRRKVTETVSGLTNFSDIAWVFIK